jgi:YidC/Oxa1 family membrane protein insertase
MTDPSFFNKFFIWPILNLLLVFHKIFEIIGIPGALGLSIIFLTILVRVILWPLTAQQLKSVKKMTDLRPRLEELKKRFGNDKQRLQREQMALYKEHGVNPASGCLPLILQIPIFIALYQVLLQVLQAGPGADFAQKINQIVYHPVLRPSGPLDPSFLGFNLGQKPADWHLGGPLLLLVPLVTGFLQFIQSKMLVAPKGQKAEAKIEEKKEKEKQEELMTAIQSQMTYLMPGMIALFSYGFPLGLSLYWNIFTILGIIQQYLLSGPGGLSDLAFLKFLKKENERGRNNN